MESKQIAIIRVRGDLKKSQEVRDTLQMLKLYKKNSCVVVKNTDGYVGMLKKVKDVVTWGEIDKETFKLLLTKRGKLAAGKFVDENYMKEKLNSNFDKFTDDFFELKKTLKDIPGLKHFFRLKPPNKGFDKNGIKKPFSMGGALGYRKENINDLIRRML